MDTKFKDISMQPNFQDAEPLLQVVAVFFYLFILN